MSLIEQAKAERRRQLGLAGQVEDFGRVFSSIDWFNNMDALAAAPWKWFAEYAPDPERMYYRGEVIRVETYKYLIQSQGRIENDRPPAVNPLCKLFRDPGLYEWVREEYCLRGYVRGYEGKFYQVIAARVDSATPPPNDPASWKEISL